MSPESAPCGTCGNSDAFDYAGMRLCMDCYTLAGACCSDDEDTCTAVPEPAAEEEE